VPAVLNGIYEEDPGFGYGFRSGLGARDARDAFDALAV
jgi:hypothetical protein